MGSNAQAQEFAGEPARAESSPGTLQTMDLARLTPLEVEAKVPLLAQLIDGAPDVSVCTAVLAGAMHDPDDSPGVHRVLAEILRDGGYNSSSTDYSGIVGERGGKNEVHVLPDSTVYCTTLPSSEVELALWVASSRFSASALTGENLSEAVSKLSLLAEQRDAAVYEGRAPVRLRRMAYLGTDALGHPALPSPEELEQIELEQIQLAHQEAYVGQRAVISIVGGGGKASTEAGVSRYLQRMHRGEASKLPQFSLVKQHTMRFSMDEDRSAKTPAAWYGWIVPSPGQGPAVHAALNILMSDARLGKKILAGSRPAKRATLDFRLERTRVPSLARLEVIGRYNHALGLVEKELNRQLRTLGQNGPTPAELKVYASDLLTEQREELRTSLDRAFHLSRGVLAGFSPEEILAPLQDEYHPDLPTVAQIRTAALTLLDESQRSVVEVYPKGWQDPWQAPMPLYHIVERGQTLGSIASRYGTSVAVITKMNGIRRNKPIYPGDKLKVPRGKQKKERPARTHQVRRGDTLSGIAVKYGIQVRDIAAANGMGRRQTIRIGETLTIPWAKSGKGKGTQKNSSGEGGASPSKSPAGRSHQVTSGETLSGIAHKYHVSTVALARENGISHKAMVKIGQKLKVPTAGTGKKKPAPSFVTYTVKAGDNLSKIAQRHHVTVAEITVANRMSRKATLRPGRTLKIPKRDP